MNEEKKQLKIFLGMKTTGKDYTAKEYLENGYKKIAFANPLREMLWSILGWEPKSTEEYNELKETPLTTEKMTKIFGFIPNFETKKITTIRKMLQNLGSEMKNKFGETYWANLWCQEVLNSNCNIVCTDARFTYELKKALSLTKKGYKVEFIWCCYNKADFISILKDTHESEALAQYIYWHQSNYNLSDGCKISHATLQKIIKDYENFKTTKRNLEENLGISI